MPNTDKQEAPSAHKIRKAREEGNVSRSPELVGFFGILAGMVCVFFLIGFWIEGLEKIYLMCLGFFNTDLNMNRLFHLFFRVLIQVVMMLIPLFILLVLAGIVSNILQFGFLFSPKILKPKFEKLNPIHGLKNMFSLKKLLEGGMITLKVLACLCLGGMFLLFFLKEIPSATLLSLPSQMSWLKDKSLLLIGSILILFLILAISDFFIKKYQYIKSLRMSKQEVKDEYRQQEGNPEVRAKIRQIMMKNTISKMMKAIPTADVVITNPTHYAIALRFRENDIAPVVVAKGVDYLAIRIKGIAREHGIEIVENKPLARELYKQVDLEQPIPRSLFEAVAVVFAQLKNIQEKHSKSHP